MHIIAPQYVYNYPTLLNMELTMYKSLALIFVLLIANHVHAYDCAILLHGLARTQSSMTSLESALSAEGYTVINQGYDSRSQKISVLSNTYIPIALSQCRDADIIHFVTHSMGGILVRYYLSERKIEKLGRVVMLGPPNKGSQVIDNMSQYPGFELINGPGGLQLGTSEASIPNSIGPATFDLGIIAGKRTINPILSLQLPNPDDGKVSVENTKVEGMNDHIVLPVTHTFMMRNKAVIKQVIYYLKSGRFKHNKPQQIKDSG